MALGDLTVLNGYQSVRPPDAATGYLILYIGAGTGTLRSVSGEQSAGKHFVLTRSVWMRLDSRTTSSLAYEEVSIGTGVGQYQTITSGFTPSGSSIWKVISIGSVTSAPSTNARDGMIISSATPITGSRAVSLVRLA